jgi:hypothetical protein
VSFFNSKGFTLFKDRSVGIYNPELVSLVIGSQPVKDFAQDIINVVFQSDNISVVKGIDGNSALLRQTNADAEITFTLLQMSQTNKWLFDMQSTMLDRTKPIPLPSVTFSDYNLKVSWSSSSAFIKKHPDINYSSTAGATTWIMYCTDCKINQNISVDDSFFSSEQVLFEKVGQAIKSVGKQIKSVFS